MFIKEGSKFGIEKSGKVIVFTVVSIDFCFDKDGSITHVELERGDGKQFYLVGKAMVDLLKDGKLVYIH